MREVASDAEGFIVFSDFPLESFASIDTDDIHTLVKSMSKCFSLHVTLNKGQLTLSMLWSNKINLKEELQNIVDTIVKDTGAQSVHVDVTRMGEKPFDIERYSADGLNVTSRRIVSLTFDDGTVEHI